jgi:hypothetical protein
MPTHKDNAKYQQAYRERMKAAGFVQLVLWVPRNAVDKVKAYAARLLRAANGSSASRKGE